MEIDSFVSVYEDNFRCFYDQYFAQALLQMKNQHLIIREKLPGSLANFIIWLCQQKNVTSSEIYLSLNTLLIKFNSRGYPIIEVWSIPGNLLHTYASDSQQFPSGDEEIKQALSRFSQNDIKDFPWDKCVIDERKYLYYEGYIPSVFDFYCQLKDKNDIHGAYIKDGDTTLQIDIFNGTKIRFGTNVLYIDHFTDYSLDEKIRIINIITSYICVSTLCDLIKTGRMLGDIVDCEMAHYSEIEYYMDETLSAPITFRLPQDIICPIKKKVIIDEKFVIILLDVVENKFTLTVMLRRTYDKMVNNFILLCKC